METRAVQMLVEAVEAVDDPAASVAALTAAGAALRRLKGWLEGREAGLARRLAECTAAPEQALAQVGRTTVREAERVLERGATVAAMPPLGVALAEGAVRGAHVDVVTRALASLEPAQRPALVAEQERLVDAARHATPEEFRTTVAAAVRRLQADGGMALLERQRRNSRLRTWTDRTTGMWHLAGQFDPQSGLMLNGRLAGMVATLFRDTTPANAPTDPGERQDHLRALALVELTAGRGVSTGRPEVVVVVDTTHTDDGMAHIDWGLPVELPAQVLGDVLARAGVYPVVLCQGAVVYAPGRVELGRSTRVANQAQRRALRACHPTCVVPGCEVRFDHCKIHHIRWWRHGGPTDLVNLAPVCERHHHAIHDRGWVLHVGANRSVTVTLPDGTVLTGPTRGSPARPAATPQGRARSPGGTP